MGYRPGMAGGLPPHPVVPAYSPSKDLASLAETCLGIGLLESPSEMLADPGFGTVRLLFWGESDDEGILNAINDVRLAGQRYGASVVVEICHPSVKVNLDIWGPEPASMEIMRRIKEQFDPQRLLNRGRFLGRI